MPVIQNVAVSIRRNIRTIIVRVIFFLVMESVRVTIKKGKIVLQHTLCSVNLDNHCMFLYFTLACKGVLKHNFFLSLVSHAHSLSHTHTHTHAHTHSLSLYIYIYMSLSIIYLFLLSISFPFSKFTGRVFMFGRLTISYTKARPHTFSEQNKRYQFS